MIMSVIPERPKSADSHEEARKTYLREIDYTGSIMYTEVLRRNSIKTGKPVAPIAGIPERREDDEDEQMVVTLPDGSLGKPSRLKKSGLELQGQQSSVSIGRGPLEAENSLCYSQIELEYLTSLLKNKSAMA